MADRTPGLEPPRFHAAGPGGARPRWRPPAAGTAAPLLEPRLRAISRLNDWVGEKILLSPTRLAPRVSGRRAHRRRHSFRRTPSRATGPARSRHRAGRDWALEVGGLVRTPTRLTRAMLEALPRVTYTVKHHCVEGWTAMATWTGVPVSAVADMVQPTPEARYLRFDSFDSRYSNGWDLASAMHPQTILAYAYNDRPLMAEHGAPLRLYSPIKLGYKMTKYLTAMTFTRERPGGYWEDQGYPWLGGI